GRCERFVVPQRAGAARLGDADGFLIDDAAGADVLMPDLAVAHGALGQADVFTAGADERPGPISPECVVDGRAGEAHGVEGLVLRIRILPPAISDDEDERGVAG